MTSNMTVATIRKLKVMDRRVSTCPRHGRLILAHRGTQPFDFHAENNTRRPVVVFKSMFARVLHIHAAAKSCLSHHWKLV